MKVAVGGVKVRAKCEEMGKIKLFLLSQLLLYQGRCQIDKGKSGFSVSKGQAPGVPPTQRILSKDQLESTPCLLPRSSVPKEFNKEVKKTVILPRLYLHIPSCQCPLPPSSLY